MRSPKAIDRREVAPATSSSLGAHELVAAPPRAPVRTSRPGFFSGVRALGGGVSTLLSTPSLWLLSLVPMVMAFAVTGILAAISMKLVPGWVAHLVGTTDAWWSMALQGLLTALAVVLSFLIALGVAQPLSGPALDAIVRRVGKTLGEPARTETPFFIAIGRSLGSALLGFGFGLPFLLLALLLNFVPGGSFVAVPLKLLIAMIALGWDLCDYPLSARGAPLGDRIRFMARHIGPVLGFSLGLTLVALLPCGALLILPAGVCGATRLVHDIERYEAGERG